MTRLPAAAIAVLSISVALVSWRFLALGLDAAFAGMGPHLALRPWAFLAHVVAAPVALGLGALQLLPRLRARRPDLHRWFGRVYVLACVLGAVAGLWLAFGAIGGPLAGAGFGLLAILWLACTLAGARHARRGETARHRRWMIRSFALAFAAVTLRLQLPLLLATGMDYPEASVILAWSCWLPNIALAEWLLARRPAPAAAPA